MNVGKFPYQKIIQYFENKFFTAELKQDGVEFDNNVGCYKFLNGKVTIRKSRDGNYFEVVDKDSNATLAEITQDGQINLYGRAGIANGAINLYTSDKKKRYIINSLNGNIFIELYNANEELKAVIDSDGMSKLLGLDVQNNKITNLSDPELDSDAVNLGKVKALIAKLVDSSPETLDTLNELANALGDDPNFATTVSTAIGHKMSKSSNLSDVANRQTAVNNLFDAPNLTEGQTLIKDEYGNMVAGNAGGGANLGRTYFISDTEESDTWEAGKKNFKTLMGFLAIFDNNTEILHYHSVIGDLANNSPTILNIADTTPYNIGDIVSGHANIPYGAVILSKTANSITMSLNATGTANGAKFEVLNKIYVNISGGQISTSHINRRNITYTGIGTIVHNSNAEYIIEWDLDALKQPNTFFDSSLNLISVGTKGLFRNGVPTGNARSAISGLVDAKFKFKNYSGKQSGIHFNTTQQDVYNGQFLFYNNNFVFEYDTIDVVGNWQYGYSEQNSKFKYRGSLIRATNNVFWCGGSGADFDIESEITTTDPSNYYAFRNPTYQGVGNCFITAKITGKISYSGGGVFNIRCDNGVSEFSTAVNYYKELIINGSFESALTIRGQVHLNARFDTLYCKNGYGITHVKGTHGNIYVDEACDSPLMLEVGTNYNNTFLYVTANRTVISSGRLYNMGYSASVSVTAGHLINTGIIQDGYYGVQVSGSGKFTNANSGIIMYSRIGIYQDGGTVILLGRIENYGGTEVAPIKKISGNLTIGAGCRCKSVGTPILCTSNNVNSRNVKFETGWAFNFDPKVAHPSGFAPIPVIDGSGTVDSNID